MSVNGRYLSTRRQKRISSDTRVVSGFKLIPPPCTRYGEKSVSSLGPGLGRTMRIERTAPVTDGTR